MKPLRLKLNPIWWFKNDDDVPPPGYTPLTWFLRNPMHNFMAYVIGFKDRTSVTVYSKPYRDDDTHFAPHGWLFIQNQLQHISLPFVSYAGDNLRFYLGWRPGGMFGIRFTINKER